MDLTTRLLAELGLPPVDVSFTGRGGLASPFAVDALAGATIGAATAAVAMLHAHRAGEAISAVSVDRDHAAIAFQSERHLRALDGALPPAWDPLAGDYATLDGTIRIHTNYAYHRAAALAALGGVPGDRAAVTEAVAGRDAEELEAAIVAAGGAAARLRTVDAWAAHPQGQAVAAEPLVALAPGAAAAPLPRGRALAGLRVLDLTRVIAGPVATRFLAAYGADVLRLDPPGFAEVPLLVPEVSVGKRRAFVDLAAPEGAAIFARLLDEADVLVHGYRPGSRDLDAIAAAHPSLVVVALDAYGFTGPWRERRGFDSLVQASSGIALRCRESTGTAALPAQALDHGAGYLVAAAAAAGLLRRAREGRGGVARVSLARIAALLVGLGETGDPAARPPEAGPWLVDEDSAFGRLRRVRVPGSIAGLGPSWPRPAGPLGSDPPCFGAAPTA